MPIPEIAVTDVKVISTDSDSTPNVKAQILSQYQEKVREIEEEEAEAEAKAQVSEIVQYLHSVWQTNSSHFNTFIQPILDECTRRLHGKYDSKTKKLIADSGGTDIYLPIAAQIANIAESWLIDILSTSTTTNRPWRLDPTPIPDLPKGLEERINEKWLQEIEEAKSQGAEPTEDEKQMRLNELYEGAFQEVNSIARQAVEAQQALIDDVFEEANFIGELKKFISLLTKYPTAFLWGPFYKKVVKSQWVNGKLNQYEGLQEFYKAVSPYDCFPSPNATGVNDGDFIHRIRLTRRELVNLKGLDGSDDYAIDEVLNNFNGLARWVSWQLNQQEKEDLELRNSHEPKYSGTVEVLCFYCEVPAKTLVNNPIAQECLEDEIIEIEAMLVDNYLIRCNIVDTKKPYFRRPFYFTSYRKKPDSIWGESPILIAGEVEDICNSSVRALVNNLSIASGPQVAVDPAAIPQGQDIESLHPWQIWQVSAINTTSGKLPIQFFQPNSNSNELVAVFNVFLQRASEITGIPWFVGGSNPTAGAAATAKGLSQLLEASAKGIKLCLSNITEDVIKPAVYQQFISNMVKGKGALIYGDVRVIPSGFNALVLGGAQEERVREFIQLVAKAPLLLDIIGIEGFTQLLRKYGEVANLDINGVIPSEEELRVKLEKQAQAEQKPSPEEIQAQLEQAKIELDKYKADQRQKLAEARLQLDQAKMQLQMEIEKLRAETELRKQNMKDQADIQEAIAQGLAKERQIAREGEIKREMGSGI